MKYKTENVDNRNHMMQCMHGHLTSITASKGKHISGVHIKDKMLNIRQYIRT